MIGRKNIMGESTLPIWSLDHHHRQNQVQEELFKGKEGNGSPTDHINHQQNFSQFAALSEVAELTWENGQLAMHELPTKPAWGGRTGDTLESIVHQATIFNNNIHYQNPNLSKQQQQQQQQRQHNMETVDSVVASCGEKCTENPRQVQAGGHKELPTKRRERPTDYDQRYGRKVMANFNNSILERKGDDEWTDKSVCASAAVGKNNSDTTMTTWASLESPTSTKTKTTDDDSACHDGSENLEEERETRSEIGRSTSARRGRAAAVHNQSERRRRDRINQKMKALQKLVPNASKTDKASMLDEVIDYLKQLQAQVQMFNRYMPQPQFMMPLGMQQHIQMSLLARMGMGMGMLDMSRMACPAAMPQPMSTLVHPNPVANDTTSTFGAATTPFLVPPVIPNPSMPTVTQKPINDPGISADPLQDPYNAMLAQSMNADLYNRMAALHRQQQINQNTQAASSKPQTNPAQRG